MKSPLRKLMFGIKGTDSHLFFYCFENEIPYFTELMKIKKSDAYYITTFILDSSISNIINCKKHKFYIKEI